MIYVLKKSRKASENEQESTLSHVDTKKWKFVSRKKLQIKLSSLQPNIAETSAEIVYFNLASAPAYQSTQAHCRHSQGQRPAGYSLRPYDRRPLNRRRRRYVAGQDGLTVYSSAAERAHPPTGLSDREAGGVLHPSCPVAAQVFRRQ